MNSSDNRSGCFQARSSARVYDALPVSLRDDVRTLGTVLGKVIAEDRGAEFLHKIEEIRALAKRARSGGEENWEALRACLRSLPDESLIDIARAFNQFLNLANIAEQQYHALPEVYSPVREWDGLIRRTAGFRSSCLEGLRVELVLTAHPTEVLRRTMIRKYDAIASALAEEPESTRSTALERLIAEAWHTNEVRRRRPTPLDEAKWGFAVIENSLWDAVPMAMRAADEALIGRGLPPAAPAVMPIRFASWMGGDRDGNPNVTASVTAATLKLARWMAADLFIRDVQHLVGTLSMSRATPEFRKVAEQSEEPYRAVLRKLRGRLYATRDWAEDRASGSQEILNTNEDLRRPLDQCYQSLCACGLHTIANGALLDTLRRAHCFGITLIDLDLRQHADRHTQVFDELHRYFDPQSVPFPEWEENEKQAFLLRELASQRPLFPRDWPMSEAVGEVLETFRTISRAGSTGIGSYIISMSARPSDVLQVALLLRAHGCDRPLRITPLFETLDDLQRAPAVIDELFSIGWYRARLQASGNRQQVMIGYSDSAKDAGPLAAAWAQYRAQEGLVKVARKHGVDITLFHGRGGAVGRGGGPAHHAIRAQPPGSVNGFLRVTEQGEMIRFKLGAPFIAVETITRYLVATLEATLAPPGAPHAFARKAMDEMAIRALGTYREIVEDTPEFVPMFQALTPERELAELALGSRPSRREPSTDIESLRAIPWVFAWTQIRLMIPGWLGSEEALGYLLNRRGLFDKLIEWPFFRMQIDLLELMATKAEPKLVDYYVSRLTNTVQRELAQSLIERLSRLRSTILELRGTNSLLADQPQLRDSLQVRNTYLDPLHLLQAELLYRIRDKRDNSQAIKQSLKVTMAGIASGLRNSG